MKKRALLYIRVSTQEQVKEGYSIDEQIDRLGSFCKAMNWAVADTYVDGGYSGGNTDRPALQDLLRDVRAGKGDIVAVYKLDRLSRSQKDTLSLIEDDFLANNVDFVSMTENFDTSTPFGRAMIGILSVFAQLEREQIKERMKMGKAGRSKEGKWKGGVCPIGYDYIDGKLIINDYEAMQIRELHKLYQQGKALREIERIFADKGYAHKHGTWNVRRLTSVLFNELYLGKIKYHDEILDGIHEPIIDQATYEATQAVYNAKDHTSTYSGKRSYLSGLVFCAHCGARYFYYQNRGNKKIYYYYGCYSRLKRCRVMIKDPNCRNETWSAPKLEQIILSEIQKLANDPAGIHKIRQASISDDSKDKADVIRKEIEKIDVQKSRFMDLYGLGGFSAEELTAKIKPLNDRKAGLEQELLTLSDNKKSLSEDQALEIVRNFNDVLEQGDKEQIRLLIHSLIEKIEIDGQNIDIFWRFA